MERPARISAVSGALGLLLVVGGIVLLWAGVSSDHPGLSVLGILAGVPGLVGLRVRHWIRKERVMRRVGEDLHVPPPD
jgi:hypothetical protein